MGKIRKYDAETGISTATPFTGTTLTNGNDKLVTVGSQFKAKYTAKSSSTGNGATIIGTTNNQALSTTDTTYVVSGEVTISLAGSSGGGICIMPDTYITLADGRRVMISELTGYERVLTFNVETNEIEESNILALWHHGTKSINVISLSFSNGSIVQIVQSHSFYDIDQTKYVNVTPENYMEMIGMRVYDIDGNIVSVVNTSLEVVESDCYSILTENNGNCYTNGILSKTPDPFTGYFETIYQLESDSEYRNQMLELYGEYTYEEVDDLITEEAFNKFYIKYFKVFIGLGLIVEQDVQNILSLAQDIIYLS